MLSECPWRCFHERASLKALVSLSIRRNRQSYILAFLALTAVFSAVIIALGFFSVEWTFFMTIMWWFVVPYLICGGLLTSQRLRDFGLPGWLALLWVPIAFSGGNIGAAAALIFFLVLCAVPGTAGDNRYGADPLGEVEV